MKMMLGGIGLMVFIIGLSYIAAMVERNNGIPDVISIINPDTEALKAEETLQAPFAETLAPQTELPADIDYRPHEGSKITETLAVPHLHDAAVSEWLSTAVSEAMTFMPQDYQRHLQDLREFMTPNGVKEFQRFMTSTNALSIMQGRNLKMRSFLEQPPLLRTSGVTGDTYKWVYDVPVNMSFLPPDMNDYRSPRQGTDDFLNESIIIRIQLARALDTGRDGLVIETWELIRQ